MKKYLTGLLMCWGNFFWIPSPGRKWDEDAKEYMLSWLPTIGTFIGLIWMGVTLLIFKLRPPVYVTAFVLTFIPFLMSGFIHVDGFMDVSDALASYGTIEKKQQILKDSRVGSGSVIRIIFYILAFYSFILATVSGMFSSANFLLIPMVSRTIAAMFVMLSKKIGEDDTSIKSQYLGMEVHGLLFLTIQFIIYMIINCILTTYLYQAAIIMLSVIAGTSISILIAKKKLGGMNGDIAGFGIMIGELLGVISLSIF